MTTLAAPPLPHQATAIAGRGRVTVERHGSRSVVRELYAASPLRLLTPANHGSAAWIFTSSFGGGFVDGDRVEMDVSVSAAAALYLSSQASTKVYKSPRGTGAVLRASVAREGLLVLIPDPVVCFEGSRYTQRQEFDLGASASAVVVDWVTSGRWASGERWRFLAYETRTVVRYAGQLVAHDAVVLRQTEGRLDRRLPGTDVLATVMLVGPATAAGVERSMRAVGAMPLAGVDGVRVSVAPLRHDAGCALRLAGPSVQAVGQCIRELLDFVPALLGDDPWARKW